MNIRHVILLPLRFNNGEEVPRDLLDKIFDDLFVIAGGYHIAGEGEGAYRMKSGHKQIDRSLEVWVVIDESQYAELKSLVEQIAVELDQESIYFERLAGSVEFVRPPIAKEPRK